MENAFYLVMNVLRVYAIYLLIDVFISKKDISSKIFFLTYAAYYVVNSLLYLTYHSVVVNIATNVIPIFLITFLYKAKIGKRIFVTVLIYAIAMFVESSLFALCKILSFNSVIVYSGFAPDIMMFFIAMLAQAILKGKFKTLSSVRAIYYIVIVFVPVGSIVIGYFTLGEWDLKTVIVAAILLVINFLVFYFFDEISTAYKYRYEASLLQRQNEIQLANYTEISRNYQESQKIIHDIKKHLYTMSQLANIDREKADNYRKIIENSIDSLVFGFNCTNQILSIVMSQKISVAESENIKVKTDVEDLSLDFIDDIDITAIFANLWDNAIEACALTSVNERFIDFSMSQVNGFIIINIQNSCDNDPVSKNGRFVSTKKNHKGIGLSIVSTAVEKYNGLFITDYQNNTFTVEITIPVPVK